MAEDRGEHGERPNFPVAAAEFTSHVEGHLARVQARVEKVIADKQIPADKAGEMRKNVQAGAAATRTELAKVTADGTVTADEAKAVREAGRAFMPHGREGHGGPGCDHKGAKGKAAPPKA